MSPHRESALGFRFKTTSRLAFSFPRSQDKQKTDSNLESVFYLLRSLNSDRFLKHLHIVLVQLANENPSYCKAGAEIIIIFYHAFYRKFDAAIDFIQSVIPWI